MSLPHLVELTLKNYPLEDKKRAERLFTHLDEDVAGLVSPDRTPPWDEYRVHLENNRAHGMYIEAGQWLALYPANSEYSLALLCFDFKPEGILRVKQLQGKKQGVYKPTPFPKRWPYHMYGALVGLARESGYLEVRVPQAEDHQWYETPFRLQGRPSAEYRAAMRYYYDHVPKKMGFSYDLYKRERVFSLQPVA